MTFVANLSYRVWTQSVVVQHAAVQHAVVQHDVAQISLPFSHDADIVTSQCMYL
jgi:hypothetical protein